MPTPPLTPPNHKPPSAPNPPYQPGAGQPGAGQPLAPRPLQPRTPNFSAAAPIEAPAPPVIPVAAPETDEDEDYDPHPNIPKIGGPRRKCPECQYFPMLPLAQFKDDDIREEAVQETFMPTGFLGIIAPALSVILIVGSALGNLISAKSTDASKRAKLRRARTEILARCPNSVICPQCCEVLEIF